MSEKKNRVLWGLFYLTVALYVIAQAYFISDLYNKWGDVAHTVDHLTYAGGGHAAPCANP